MYIDYRWKTLLWLEKCSLLKSDISKVFASFQWHVLVGVLSQIAFRYKKKEWQRRRGNDEILQRAAALSGTVLYKLYPTSHIEI